MGEGRPSELDETRLVERIDSLVSAFENALVDHSRWEADRTLAPDLAHEARPAIQALHFALTMETAADEHSLEHHEGIAMVNLLGRRAALLGASPFAIRRLVPALVGVFAEVPGGYVEVLSDAAIEGYVRGREERLTSEAALRAAEGLVSAELLPGVWLFVLAGQHPAELLQARAEELGRELFSHEAKACVIEMSRLRAPDRSRAAAVLDAFEAARLVGTFCVLSGPTPGWRSHFAEFPVSDLEVADNLQLAMEQVLAAAGVAVRPRLDAQLKKLLGR